MNPTLRCFLVLTCLLAWTSLVQADLITFDDLPDESNPIPSDYRGFSWNNFGHLNGYTNPNTSGYLFGVISPFNVANNRYGNPASISSTTAFTLVSGYFTGAWRDGLEIQVIGKLGGGTKYDTSFTVDSTAPTFHVFDYQNIDEVTFIASGGTHHGYAGQGTLFALDNLTVQSFQPTPEPGSLVLVGIGLAGLGLRVSWRARRRSSKTVPPAV